MKTGFHGTHFVLSMAAAGMVLIAHAATSPATSTDDEHVRVELISEHLALTPGQSQQLGILLRHEPHWHTYWINPGDSGLPTTLAWTLPSGFKTADVVWPLPKRFDVGGLYNFGYDDETVLPIALSVPADAKPGSTAHLSVDAKWLVCREECIPGRKTLTLDLPVASANDAPKPDPRWTMQFSRARLAEPQASAWKSATRVDGDRIVVTLRGPGLPDKADGLDAFVEERKLVDNKPPAINEEGDALVVAFAKSEYFATAPETFDLVLTQPSGTGVRGWRVRVPFAAAAAP
ncbi:MAG TPA: protein-disulfide reductase DsbD domain-containing protein [Rhodanobacteraceae bacterium]|nr:protein-disulfide reductase DsbD domain-containing protein [Rhodanobacteraceae bacterium]